jgi:plastocyanin
MRVNRILTLLLLIAIVACGSVAVALWSKSSTASGFKKYQVVISDNKVTPEVTYGRLCDTLTITNQDATTRLMAFGDHDHHTPYDGVRDRLLNRGESLTITFNQIGTFHFHDHVHDEVQGFFMVTD